MGPGPRYGCGRVEAFSHTLPQQLWRASRVSGVRTRTHGSTSRTPTELNPGFAEPWRRHPRLWVGRGARPRRHRAERRAWARASPGKTARVVCLSHPPPIDGARPDEPATRGRWKAVQRDRLGTSSHRTRARRAQGLRRSRLAWVPVVLAAFGEFSALPNPPPRSGDGEKRGMRPRRIL